MVDYITVIGGGLAGCEAAYQIAKRGIKVKLYEMKPVKFSPAHSNTNLAEIVCSNSFKSNLHTNACGLLKEELRMLDSLLIKTADIVAVPAGQALAVDREKFAEAVTKKIESLENVEIVRKEVGKSGDNVVKSGTQKFSEGEEPLFANDIASLKELAEDGIVIIATGPLTSDNLSKEIIEITGNEGLHFYDAAAPIVQKESIDFNIAFWGDRYEQEREKDEDVETWKVRIKHNKENNYINLPMNKEEYENFWKELVNAEVVELHNFEKREIFEGCMPIEVMAKRGIDTLRFGPLKPVGFTDPRTGKRPYAVVQLRQDNTEGNLFNIVGFQTNLKYGEQKRVFSLIPGLQNADFVKYGVMHRNTFINSPELLDETYNLKKNRNIFFAGQITGVEGYVESIASGLVAGLNATLKFKKTIENNNRIIDKNNCDIAGIELEQEESNEDDKITFPKETMIGALSKYIATENKNFQPMNANFGILPELPEKIRDKKLKYGKLADRAIESLKKRNVTITLQKCFLNSRKLHFLEFKKHLKSLLPLRFPPFSQKLKSARTKSDFVALFFTHIIKVKKLTTKNF